MNIYLHSTKQFEFPDGDIKVSLEQWTDGPDGSGTMRKILVGMKIPYAAPPVGQLRFKVSVDEFKTFR